MQCKGARTRKRKQLSGRQCRTETNSGNNEPRSQARSQTGCRMDAPIGRFGMAVAKVDSRTESTRRSPFRCAMANSRAALIKRARCFGGEGRRGAHGGWLSRRLCHAPRGFNGPPARLFRSLTNGGCEVLRALVRQRTQTANRLTCAPLSDDVRSYRNIRRGAFDDWQ